MPQSEYWLGGGAEGEGEAVVLRRGGALERGGGLGLELVDAGSGAEDAGGMDGGEGVPGALHLRDGLARQASAHRDVATSLGIQEGST